MLKAGEAKTIIENRLVCAAARYKRIRGQSTGPPLSRLPDPP